MNFKKNLTFKSAIIIKEDDLIDIYKFLINNYKEIKMEAFCIDNTNIHFELIEDIINYNNYSNRRILEIQISAKNDYDNRLNLKIGTKNYKWPHWKFIDISEETFELDISTNDEEKLNAIINKFTDLNKSIKQWYGIISTTHLYQNILIISILSTLYGFFKTQIFKSQTNPTVSLSLVEAYDILISGVVILIIVMYLLELIKRYLFPKVFFLIGRQKDVYKRVSYVRNLVFITIGLSIIIGVLVNKLT